MGERQTHWREIDGREREMFCLISIPMCVCVYICVCVCTYVCQCLHMCVLVFLRAMVYTCAIASCIRVRLRHDCLLIQTIYSVFQRACIFFGGRGGTSKHFGIIHGDFERRDHHWQPSSRALCVCMSHVRYNKESHHTHQAAKSHISSIFFDTQMTKSFYTYM